MRTQIIKLIQIHPQIQVQVRKEIYQLDPLEEYVIAILIAGKEIALHCLTWLNSPRGGLFPTAPSRGQAKKKHVALRKKLGVDKREYSRIMGEIGGIISKYFGRRW